MRALLLSLTLFAASCVKGGVSLDDTNSADTDADTDTDTDTDTDADTDADTDTDPPLPARWAGVVGMMAVSSGVPFCEGEVELSLESIPALEGTGWCLVQSGPGQGQQLLLGFSGEVQAEGALVGEVSVQPDGMPEAPPPVSFSGMVNTTELTMGFEIELRPPDRPEGEVVVGEVVAAPAP